jgi:hypothetical protein
MRPDVSEDESALIYGLESQARSLAAGPSGSPDSGLIRFVVGTQSVKSDNFVHVLEYMEETHSLSKTVIKHEAGEVCSLTTSPTHGQLLLSCYGNLTSDGKYVNRCSLWKFPLDITASLSDEDLRVTGSTTENLNSLEKVCDFNPGEDVKIFGKGVWKPDEANEVITFSEDKIFIWDIESHSMKRIVDMDCSKIPSIPTSSRLSKTSAVRWSPHCNANILGAAIGSHILGLDLRSPNSPFVWDINAHNNLTRDVDFNPNAQYYLASCGDDCESRFWDVRNPSSPVTSLQNHAHWIWSVRYNAFHDQLVLTCSSDSRVVLSRISSLASQPFGHLLEDDDSLGDEELTEVSRGNKNMNEVTDGVVATYEEHEESVYCAEWSSSDPWVFASLSFDGRLVINKVPKSEKFNILF